jgi:S1-C subfamily serine protease
MGFGDGNWFSNLFVDKNANLPPEQIPVLEYGSSEVPIFDRQDPAVPRLVEEWQAQLDPKRHPRADEATRKVYKKVDPSVVQTEGRDAQGKVWGGSGCAIGDGEIVMTAAHVVNHLHNIRLRSNDGKIIPADVIEMDPVEDWAILLLQGRRADIPRGIFVGNLNKFKKGDPIYSLGHAEGLAKDYISPGTYQKISSPYEVYQGGLPARAARFGNEARRFLDRKYVVVNSHVRPGCSGGPLVDSYGRLVGLTNARKLDFHAMSIHAPIYSFAKRLEEAQKALDPFAISVTEFELIRQSKAMLQKSDKAKRSRS